MLIGLIADTHGYLDPRVPPALKGVQLILHAGDIGAEGVLVALARIAPVTAVAGNNDANLAQLGLPLRVDMDLEGVRIHLVHRLIDAAPGPDARVVVYGHSHKTLVAEREGMLWVNPGAAGRNNCGSSKARCVVRRVKPVGQGWTLSTPNSQHCTCESVTVAHSTWRSRERWLRITGFGA